MNFGQLQMDLIRRGNFGEVAQDRLKRWVNESYHEICNAADWPFLEATTSGAAPVTVADLRKVISVHDATNRIALTPTTRRWVLSHFGDIASTSGVARFYYVDNGVIKAYPVAGTLSVYYIKFPADLSATTDSPVVPTRFHSIIVDGAVRRAYEDADRFQESQAIEQSRLLRLENMKTMLLTQATVPEIDDDAQASVTRPAPQMPQK